MLSIAVNPAFAGSLGMNSMSSLVECIILTEVEKFYKTLISYCNRYLWFQDDSQIIWFDDHHCAKLDLEGCGEIRTHDLLFTRQAL